MRRPLPEVLQASAAVEDRKAALHELAACCRDYLDALEEDPRGDDVNVDLRAGLLASACGRLYVENAKL